MLRTASRCWDVRLMHTVLDALDGDDVVVFAGS